MASVPVIAVACSAFACVWLLLGFACGPGAMHKAARERIRLRLMGWASALAYSRAARFLSGIGPLTEVGAACARRFAAKGFDIGAQAGSLLVASAAVPAVLIAGIVAQSWLGLAVGAVAVCVVIATWGASLRLARRRELEREMPRVFRSLAGSLAAGRTLPQALAALGRNRDVTSEVYGRAALAMACGFSATDALTQLARELDVPGGELLVSALLVSHRTGSPLMGLFGRAALIVEKDAELERQLSVKTAQVRLSVRVVCVLPALMVGILTLISPDFRAGLATEAGRASLTLAVLLDLVAIFIVRRLLAGVI